MIAKRYFRRIFEAMRPIHRRWDLSAKEFSTVCRSVQRSFSTIAEAEICAAFFVNRAEKPPTAHRVRDWRRGTLPEQLQDPGRPVCEQCGGLGFVKVPGGARRCDCIVVST